MADTIGRGDYSKSLKTAFGLTGRTAYGLDQTIVPVVGVGDLDGPPFHSKRGYTRFASAPATAGQYSSIVLWVPDDPGYDNVILVVRSIYVFTLVQSFVHIDPGLLPSLRGYPVLPVGGLSPISWDQGGKDATGTKAGAANYSPHFGVGGGDLWGQALALQPNTGQYAHPHPIVLRRNSYVEVVQNTPNQYVSAGMYWDEYTL